MNEWIVLAYLICVAAAITGFTFFFFREDTEKRRPDDDNDDILGI